VHVGPILPRKHIETLPGFNELTVEQKLKILNDPANLQPMLCSANCSKGARVEIGNSGDGWASWLGQPVSDSYRQRLQVLQAAMEKKINDLKNGG
jgi:filamentous hemagglutinin